MADKTYRVTTHMTDSWKVTAQVGKHNLVIDQGDAGANPLDTFLFSLAGCISTIAKMVAREQGFALQGVEVEVEALLNPAGLAGKQTEDPVGFKHFNIKANIDAELSHEQKAAFLELVCQRCPVHDNIMNASLVEHRLA